MSPVAYTWGPFSAKIFLKIWFCKIDPLLPPHIDFNTIPYFTYGYPYRGVKEGKLKRGKKLNKINFVYFPIKEEKARKAVQKQQQKNNSKNRNLTLIHTKNPIGEVVVKRTHLGLFGEEWL